MKHFGDITKIKGSEVPIVDIVTGGSPCQDLSVAGKRAGLDGERSGLFMEQIRIIKEMREVDKQNGRTNEFIRPRYMVWENVPGAFSSNNGEDFRVVLEETAKVVDKNAIIPRLEGKQKWTSSGVIMGDGWSIAWRVHDAQFWGVPQRRKRIALVADFGGQTAPEILFERKSVSGNTSESGDQRETVAGTVENGISSAGKCLNGWDVQSKHIQPENGIAEALYSGECRYGGGESYVQQSISFQERAGKPGGGKGILIQEEHIGALQTSNNQSVCYGISAYESNAMKSSNPHSGIYKADTSRTLDLNGGNPNCNQGGICVLEGNGSRPSHQGDGYAESEVSFTLNSVEHHAVAYRKKTHPHFPEEPQKWERTNINDSVNTADNTELRTPTLIIDKSEENKTYQKVVGCVDCGIAKGTGNQLANQDMFVANSHIVRRLTPTECERLQGYPDGWTDIGDWVDSKGKTHKGDSDSPRYKALGNSIALPFWDYLAEKMCAQYDRPTTMASLFDGIGGFPLCFSSYGCDPVWASEIEEFPIAVTKIRFPEKGES